MGSRVSAPFFLAGNPLGILGGEATAGARVKTLSQAVNGILKDRCKRILYLFPPNHATTMPPLIETGDVPFPRPCRRPM